jgi:hypothetical protein
MTKKQRKERVKLRRDIKGEQQARNVVEQGKKQVKHPTGGYGKRGC